MRKKADPRKSKKSKSSSATVHAGIAQGLRDAVAHAQRKPVPGMRVHYPDGTVEVTDKSGKTTKLRKSRKRPTMTRAFELLAGMPEDWFSGGCRDRGP